MKLMSKYIRLENDTEIIGNCELDRKKVEIEGICRGVVYKFGLIPPARYMGYLERENRELIHFEGKDRIWIRDADYCASIALMSSELNEPVIISGKFFASPETCHLNVYEIRLKNRKVSF